MWNVTSPNELLRVEVSADAQNALWYRVFQNERPVLEAGRLGFISNRGDFTKGFVFLRKEESTVDESYSLPAGKKSVYRNYASELALHFTCGGHSFILRLRAYDDGAAFRYELPETGNGFEIAREITDFHLAQGFDDLFLQTWVETYENPYDHVTWEATPDRDYGMPCLFHAKGENLWVMLTEANVYNTNGSYCSCHLRGTGERGLRLEFAPEEKGSPIPTPLPFHSPWRVAVVVEGLNELVNTTLNYNLNPPSNLKDISWITPGRCLWSWWDNLNSAQSFTEQKRYVDYAAAIGFEAVTVDAEWDLSWVRELCEYAHAKNVKIWLWSAMQTIDTPEKAAAKIPLWAGCGVDGLKVDLFHNDSQHTMWQYQMIAELMTQCRMMINFHGATKCMGEGRTWPNFMTAEGIMGTEHYLPTDWQGMPNAEHNCTIPFTRNVVGPMDYTPTCFTRPNRNTTLGHQLALPVVYESGSMNLSASIYSLEAWRGTDFLRRTKPVYEGVQVLSGYPGHHAAILRWAKGEYFIGCITNKAMTQRLPLSFLPAGIFEAEIYEDDLSGELLRVRRCKVTAADVLELPLLNAGGAAVYIAAQIGPLPQGICSGYASDDRVVYPATAGVTLRGSEPFVFENGQRAVLLNSGAEFSVTAKADGWYAVRIFYAARNAWTLAIGNGCEGKIVELPASGGNGIFIAFDVLLPLPAGENTLVLRRVKGAVPALEKLHLIANVPAPREVYLPAAHARLSGGADLVCTDDGLTRITGLGLGGEAVFAGVCLPQGGRYLMRIDYCAGESRDLSIDVNKTTYQTNLHITSGWGFPWGFPAWNMPGDNEVLIELQKGENTLRFYNDAGRSGHLLGIALTPLEAVY